jgi:hypothetical protein
VGLCRRWMGVREAAGVRNMCGGGCSVRVADGGHEASVSTATPFWLSKKQIYFHRGSFSHHLSIERHFALVVEILVSASTSLTVIQYIRPEVTPLDERGAPFERDVQLLRYVQCTYAWSYVTFVRNLWSCAHLKYRIEQYLLLRMLPPEFHVDGQTI